MRPSDAQRLSNICLVSAVLLLPLLCWMAATVRFGTAYVEAWLPAEEPSRVAYRQFINQFGSDQYLIVSWQDCRLDDPRLTKLAFELRELAVQRPELDILSIQDSASSVSDLTASLREKDTRQAIAQLTGLAIGENGTCFLALQLGERGFKLRSELISIVEARAGAMGISQEALIMAGEPFQVRMIDRASRESMQYYVLPSCVLAMASAWLCLKGLRLTLLVFAFAGVGQILGLALIAFFFEEMSAVMVVLPTLIFMLTLSGAVHLTNYYLDSGGAANGMAGVTALYIGFWPCALATLTTVIGFGSLAVSQLSPVWQFGGLASIGLTLSSLYLLSSFPAASRWFDGSRVKSGPQGALSYPSTPLINRRASKSFYLAALAAFTIRWSNVITIAGFGLLIWSVVGLRLLKTSTEFDDMFPDDSRAVQSLKWVQANLGPLNSLEFLVTFPECTEPLLLDRLTVVDRMHDTLSEQEGVKSVMSASTFLPAIPQSSGARATIQRAMFRKSLQSDASRDALRPVLAQTAGSETWRISARIEELRSDNYDQVKNALLARCEQLLQEDWTTGNSENATVSVTGLRTVIETAHRTLLSDLAGSFAAAFLLITPVMMVISRGVKSGMLLMLPNVLPVLIVFGAMGWCGIRLDVASILTASVALGIAVDDTLHFVSWFMRSRRRGNQVEVAIREAFQGCARPMLHTSIICTCAMLPFLLSDFVPTSKFALLMILILSGAILGDLILLPAILASRLGRQVGLTLLPSTQHGNANENQG